MHFGKACDCERRKENLNSSKHTFFLSTNFKKCICSYAATNVWLSRYLASVDGFMKLVPGRSEGRLGGEARGERPRQAHADAAVGQGLDEGVDEGGAGAGQASEGVLKI